jgi:hypothetical protein
LEWKLTLRFSIPFHGNNLFCKLLAKYRKLCYTLAESVEKVSGNPPAVSREGNFSCKLPISGLFAFPF